MATRYAGKYRRSPYPQATRIKTFNEKDSSKALKCAGRLICLRGLVAPDETLQVEINVNRLPFIVHSRS